MVRVGSEEVRGGGGLGGTEERGGGLVVTGLCFEEGADMFGFGLGSFCPGCQVDGVGKFAYVVKGARVGELREAIEKNDLESRFVSGPDWVEAAIQALGLGVVEA